MAKRKDRMFWESAKLNNASYIQYYNRLTELATVMFEWKNLPDSVDPRFLELVLFRDGKAVFFKDEELGHLALRCTINGKLNVYEIPMRRRAYASNGYQKNLNDKNSVIIYNNYMHTNSQLDVELFSRRLSDLDRTVDVNVKAQKTPVIVRCSEQQRMTLVNLFKQYEGNEPFIFGDKNLDLSGISVLNTTAPYVADKITALKIQIWNEALTYLGISNINFNKKERLISDEVLRGQGGTIASRYSRLEMRRQACEKINEMFKLDIWCDYREDYRQVDDEIMFPGDSGGKGQDTLAIDLRTR